jgi:hypothetical protein
MVGVVIAVDPGGGRGPLALLDEVPLGVVGVARIGRAGYLDEESFSIMKEKKKKEIVNVCSLSKNNDFRPIFSNFHKIICTF